MEEGRRPNNSAMSNNHSIVQSSRNNSNEAQVSPPPAGIAFAIVNANNANAQQDDNMNNDGRILAEGPAPAASNQGFFF